MSSASDARVPVTPLTQELRLATTMTGGVSLAVWMGGVAREINLLQQASDHRLSSAPDGFDSSTPTGELLGLYAKLLDLLDTVVDVDILSGTSAGGINAALLGYARVNNRDLGGLRELWLDLGAMLDLLRDPTDTDLPSLMYGDRKMFADLVNELPLLAASPVPRRDLPTPPTTVYITTTLLSGENSRFTDSFGTLVRDLDHHGLFTFDEDKLAANDTNIRALALAARSTASFPAAFEPSFLPSGADLPASPGVPARPDMDPYADLTAPHWAADGGLLDNQPIDVLIDRIFERPAERPVRRALLFVVPTSGPAQTAAAPKQDSADDPLGLVDALLKDLSAVTSQSITRDLNRIREHNDRMSARVDARLRLAELAPRLTGGSILSAGLFADYCTREAERIAGKLAPVLLERLATTRSTDDAMRSALAVGGNAEALCRAAIQQRLLDAWLPGAPAADGPDTGAGTAAPDGGPADVAGLAELDRPAFDVATAVALAVVRAALQAASSQEDRRAVVAALNAVHSSRPRAQDDVEAVVEAATADGGKLQDVAARVADEWRRCNAVRADNWRDLATAVSRLADVPAEPPGPPPAAHPRSVSAVKAAAAQTLHTYRSYLTLSDAADDVALRLFRLGGAQRAMLPASADEEQPLELIQVSADTRSLLAPRRPTADSKLTGLQFHHFGAFYKRTWRANDWMWGRVDGAGWLVHILLDPRRLQLVCDQGANGQKSRVAWLLWKLVDIVGDVPGSPGTPAVPLDNGVVVNRATLEHELAFLDDPTAEVPTSLPLTALWVARAFQRKVLDEEIPQLADDVGATKQEADWSPSDTLDWARKIGTGEISGDARLARCPVPDENLGDEIGSRLMVRTLAKAAATTAGALACVKQVPAAGKPALTTLRTITLGGYRAVNATGGRPRWLVGVGAALMVIGILAAVQQSSVFGLGGVGLALIGAYLIAFGAWQLRGWVLSAIVSLTIVAALATLTSSWVRHRLFGTSAKDVGWFGKHMHWVGESWWRPWAMLAAILLAGALVAVVIPRLLHNVKQLLQQRAAARRQAARRPAAPPGGGSAAPEPNSLTARV